MNVGVALTSGNYHSAMGWGVACLPAALCVIFYWE